MIKYKIQHVTGVVRYEESEDFARELCKKHPEWTLKGAFKLIKSGIKG